MNKSQHEKVLQVMRQRPESNDVMILPEALKKRTNDIMEGIYQKTIQNLHR